MGLKMKRSIWGYRKNEVENRIETLSDYFNEKKQQAKDKLLLISTGNEELEANILELKNVLLAPDQYQDEISDIFIHIQSELNKFASSSYYDDMEEVNLDFFRQLKYMKSSLFGWRKKHVKQYFKNLSRLQHNYINEMNDKIFQLIKDNQKLYLELQGVNEQLRAHFSNVNEGNIIRNESEESNISTQNNVNVISFSKYTMEGSKAASKNVIPKISNQPQIVGMGFWENIEQYVERENVENFTNASSFRVIQNKIAEPQKAKEKMVPTSLNKNMNVDETINNIDETNAKTDMQAPEKNDKSNRSDRNEASVMEDEIEFLRGKYICGKLAGSDLLDQYGHIIIKKNQEITNEIIQKADQSGKLTELIIEMIIPDLGE